METWAANGPEQRLRRFASLGTAEAILPAVAFFVPAVFLVVLGFLPNQLLARRAAIGGAVFMCSRASA